MWQFKHHVSVTHQIIISILQVAVIAGNLELADVIQFHKPEDIGK